MQITLIRSCEPLSQTAISLFNKKKKHELKRNVFSQQIMLENEPFFLLSYAWKFSFMLKQMGVKRMPTHYFLFIKINWICIRA